VRAVPGAGVGRSAGLGAPGELLSTIADQSSYRLARRSNNHPRTTIPALEFPLECSQIVSHQVSDTRQIDVRRRILGKGLCIVRVVALFRKYGGNAFTPDLLYLGQDAQFVIDEHVMIGRVETFDIFEFLLLVNVNEHTIIDRPPEA